jgi:hypothetical protein
MKRLLKSFVQLSPTRLEVVPSDLSQTKYFKHGERQDICNDFRLTIDSAISTGRSTTAKGRVFCLDDDLGVPDVTVTVQVDQTTFRPVQTNADGTYAAVRFMLFAKGTEVTAECVVNGKPLSARGIISDGS